MSVCAFSKITTAAMMVFIHLIFVISLRGRWRLKQIIDCLAFIAIGGIFNIMLVFAISPEWAFQFATGVSSSGAQEDRD